MARSLEQILTEQVGSLVLALARSTAELEAAQEKVAALTPTPADLGVNPKS